VRDELPGRPGPIVGREAQLARLVDLVNTASKHGQVLLVLGDAGMGASTLLANAADRASAAGLYRTFPKLGITGRHQLRDVITRDDA
jgi:ABC-type lipoprotein export system ATPase subunit